MTSCGWISTLKRRREVGNKAQQHAGQTEISFSGRSKMGLADGPDGVTGIVDASSLGAQPDSMWLGNPLVVAAGRRRENSWARNSCHGR